MADKIIYFHNLSEEEELYLEQKYDGILFFVDFVSTWQTADFIIKWIELQSKGTGCNIFKIPIQVIVNQVTTHSSAQIWRDMLDR